jgi:tetratricopeptide (TPR) repeat protein
VVGKFSFLMFISLMFICRVCWAQSSTSPALDLVKQGQKLNSEGKQDEALGLYRRALAMSPNLFEAHLASGMALDLEGNYAGAREEFSRAIRLAPPDAKQQALRAMAFSYAFEKNASEAAKFEQQVFEARMSTGDFVGAAEIADELARIYLESGDTANAHKWYQTGYGTAQKKADLSEAEKNLWVFRWENAQARIDVREGKISEAEQHVAAAKSALDKANSPDQLRFYPYLTGYVAFYSGDYKTAIADLEKADQRDPFILVLLAQAYERSGDQERARDYYRNVLSSNAHNPTNAFARPMAKEKLATGG